MKTQSALPEPVDDPSPATERDDVGGVAPSEKPEAEAEIGGRGGLDPTRYGDWEKNGRCIDF